MKENVEDFRFDKVQSDAIFGFFPASVICRPEVSRVVTEKLFMDMVKLSVRPNAQGDDFSCCSNAV
jgi:hypothetical protein